MTGRKSLLPEKDIPNDELYHLLDTFTRTMGEQNQWTRSTYQKFATLKRHLQDYGKIKRLGTLTDEQMQGYIKHLHERGLRNTTIAKSLSFLKWFLRWCAQNGHYKGNLHDTFKPRLKGTDGNQKEVIYLTQDELRAMQQMKFTNSQKSLERVRDVFLFCCFTGLRYSDVAKLTKADVKNDTISIVTQKTSDGIHIELNKHSKAILEKYENEEFEEDKALPIISNQKMNDYLKEIGRLCEINERARIVYFKGNERHEALHPKWKLLTTHCGRRTFVVNALRLGIPSEVIMR